MDRGEERERIKEREGDWKGGENSMDRKMYNTVKKKER